MTIVFQSLSCPSNETYVQDPRHAGHTAVSHLVRLLDRARLAGDAALYVDLQSQLARELSL